MRCFRQLTQTDRVKLELLYERNTPIQEIADILRVHRSTIYRELQRGVYHKRESNYKKYYTYRESYSSDIAQDRYKANQKTKGVKKKIGNAPLLAVYIETKIADEKYSPEAVIGEIKQKHLQFETTICTKTLYNYIDAGVFGRITNNNLVVKGKRKRKYKKVATRANKKLIGTSIEKRPEYILTREEFGHWEMDTVKGKKRSKSSILVLTERKTRKEILVKLDHHCAAAVVQALNELEAKLGSQFSCLFKTITCDNGSEFMYAKEIEHSCIDSGSKRTELYFCHPYTSCERGSNEVANKLIRRFIPKGTEFDDYDEKTFQDIEDWMNHYPRKIFNYQTAEQMFLMEISGIP